MSVLNRISPSGIPYVIYATVDVSFGLVGGGATKEVTVNVPGALAGDVVSWSLVAGTFDAGLVGSGGNVATDGVVTLRIGNITGGGITPATVTLQLSLERG